MPEGHGGGLGQPPDSRNEEGLHRSAHHSDNSEIDSMSKFPECARLLQVTDASVVGRGGEEAIPKITKLEKLRKLRDCVPCGFNLVLVSV